MGKYSRYKNRLEMFLSSEKGKRILNFAYSWGASIVIIGALFKILHLPYANQIMFISMTFEAFVFFIFGFEHPANEYHWDEVFPVLTSKNPLDRPDFHGGGVEGVAVVGGGGGVAGEGVVGSGGSGVVGGAAGGGGTVIIGGFNGGGGGVVGGGGFSGERVATGYSADGKVTYAETPKQTPQQLVNAGMSTMGLNISETDSEVLAESIKKLNSAAEQIAKMADLTEATQSYIDKISSVSENLDKFSVITGSLTEVSDSLVNSCKLISGSSEEEEGAVKSVSYVEQMSTINNNLGDLNKFYEAQLNGIRSQMDTIQHINAGLNRIRDIYDSSLVDSASFRNENERMAQLLGQLNQVYSRLLHAMTVNMQGGYPPAAPQQTVYQPPYQSQYPR
ncbi:MAG: gliding motility protein GldL [Tannerella sp.]|jgi:gliding motility-associated protein GldL|nr:gliding motility protein GldL [Tannerella sp.]